MKNILIFFTMTLFSSGCVSYPSVRNPDLIVVLFNGHGEDVEVVFGEKQLMQLANIQPDENNVAAIKKISRVPGEFDIVVKRNGKIAGSFIVNPEKIGIIYLFLSTDGSVTLEDGERLPPIA